MLNHKWCTWMQRHYQDFWYYIMKFICKLSNNVHMCTGIGNKSMSQHYKIAETLSSSILKMCSFIHYYPLIVFFRKKIKTINFDKIDIETTKDFIIFFIKKHHESIITGFENGWINKYIINNKAYFYRLKNRTNEMMHWIKTTMNIVKSSLGNKFSMKIYS